MSYLDWHVGMKVVCLDIAWPEYVADVIAMGCILPTPGKIYTIRQIGRATADAKVYVRLEEIQNPSVRFPPWRDGEPRFGARRFRPLVARKTSISIFQQMLAPSKIELGENA